MEQAPYNREFWRNFETYQKTSQMHTAKLIRSWLVFITSIVLLLAL